MKGRLDSAFQFFRQEKETYRNVLTFMYDAKNIHPFFFKGLKPFRVLGLIFIFIIMILQFGSCVNPFAPKLTNNLDTEGFIIKPQENPEEVLHNFRLAYTFKDSLLYSNTLDTSFIFVYFDYEHETSGQYVNWGRDEDLKTTGMLFRNFHIIDLVWNTTLFSWQAEDTGEIGKGFNLSLVGENGSYKVSGVALFSFRKGYDGVWRISRWRDESET